MDYQKEYGEMHAKGKYFPGFSISPYVTAIAALVDQHKPERLLDFGSGRGLQYLKRRDHEKWGGLLPHCYDIGVRGLDELPDGEFGGVLCTDVLEHIAERDVPGFIDQLLAKTAEAGFLFLVISCRPSRKRLPSGGDVHVTIKPPSWWKAQLEAAHERAALKALIVAHFDVAGHFKESDDPFVAVPF